MQIYENKSNKSNIILPSEQYGTVAVAEETEVICQSKIIYAVPVPFHKSRDKQEERALRLMEVGHKDIHYLELISRNDNDSGADLEALHLM